MNENKLNAEAVRRGDLGSSAFAREFDLTIAANVLKSMQTGETLYNTVLDLRVAERCRDLDEGLNETFLGVIDIPRNEAHPYREVDEATAFLKAKPRGHWAVFRHWKGGYDAFMSDGFGGLGTESGHKFTYRSPNAPALNFLSMYAATLGYAIYGRRNAIENEIVEASVAAANIGRGSATTPEGGIRLGAKQWDRAVFVKRETGHFVGGTDALRVELHRRGRKPAEAVIEQRTFMHIFRVAPSMPGAYVDPENVARLKSLTERREAAAQAAYDAAVSEDAPAGLSVRGSRASWAMSADRADVLTRPVFTEDGSNEEPSPSGDFEITFAPGSDEVISVTPPWRTALSPAV